MWSVILLAGLIIMVAGVVYAGFFFYGVAIKRAPKDFLAKTPDLKVDPPVAGASWGEGADWVSRQSFREAELISHDGLKLKGYFLASGRAAGRTVIIAHGYSGKAKDMGATAKNYYDNLGYNVLLPDARGHGQSEGSYIGFGWHERRDYLQWINYILEETGPEAQIVLHGVSMGGATVMMTAGEELPPQVKAVVADCGYTSVKAQLSYQLWRMYRLPSFPFVPVASLVTKLKAGYLFGEASALKQVRKARVPILFIHGDADKFVPFAMMEELYRACSSPKEQMVVHGAGHGLAYDTDKIQYVRKVGQFVERYVDNPASVRPV
ncbi:alpha/beta hydrolase [Paenibacillus sp. MMS20-IR301]|uniref:alpha/beta hydrolase n=1 Tax=Paenibacillus sp. MMS20-IR301 TaxID=2895946 RepID=UPI0028EAB47D|nr:alpha/beta hydrolase [Paenibacillus sp. MMS20-IR301]WNS41769.1 alpha/beta hydrolase [Paenibacillus sp. MMS20-IR301]